MKYRKVMASFLAFILMLPIFTVSVSADDTLGFAVSASPSSVNVGDKVEVIVSLTGYTAEAAEVDAIRGFQVDITGVDAGVLNVLEYSSLIEDSTALSNTASYQPNKSLVRLLYMQMSGTLEAPCDNVMKVVFQINPEVATSGSITLPVTVKIQTENQQITLNSELVIDYTAATTDVTSVDIVWGTMEFAYSNGQWNTSSHCYEGAGWTDSGSGYVTVKNTGSSIATATLSYQTDRKDISGTFTDGTDNIIDALRIDTGEVITVYLKLMGRPEEILDATVIGTVTVRIGGE